MDITTGEILHTLGNHSAEILMIFPVIICIPPNLERNNQENNMLFMKALVISVDKKGIICLWQEGVMVELINLSKLEGISVDSEDRYFGMGYPYALKAGGIFIAVSTDIGIIVIKSEYLKAIGGIDPLNNYTNAF